MKQSQSVSCRGHELDQLILDPLAVRKVLFFRCIWFKYTKISFSVEALPQPALYRQVYIEGLFIESRLLVELVIAGIF